MTSGILRVFVILSISMTVARLQATGGLTCWSCQENITPGCGEKIDTSKLSEIATVPCPNGVCVTFKNIFLGGKYQRNCSNSLFIPPREDGKVDLNGPHKYVDCLKDSKFNQLFCFCNTNLCNVNAGDMNIFNINECSTNPCKNGGTCTDMYNGYRCNCTSDGFDSNCDKCKPNKEGKNCDVDKKNPCLQLPCKNGGVCNYLQETYTYNCTCDTGYTGASCETEINQCTISPPPCLNNGRCIPSFNNFSCVCQNGYTGRRCETELDFCALNLDKCNRSNSECIKGKSPGTYECKCQEGYKGVYCTEEEDACQSNPCGRNGICEKKTKGDYECKCFTGWTGKSCTEAEKYCKSEPCQNGGQCIDDIGKFVCNCKNGFTGEKCETKKNPCDSNPCVNGKCVDMGNYPMYKCDPCNKGYNGTNCELKINACLSNPCKNGECIQTLGEYICACTDGYNGNDCGDLVNLCERDKPCVQANTLSCSSGTKLNEFVCECKPSYTGKLCETYISKCDPSPCKNNGICSEDGTNYQCKCDEKYYYGDRCQLLQQNCAPERDPCNKDGTELDGCEGGLGPQPVTCRCKLGYTGSRCEQQMNYCDLNPCLNNGICVNEWDNPKNPKKFYCKCSSLFDGDLCQNVRDNCKNINCNNNGKCVNTNTTSGYKCYCNVGYRGPNCEENYFTCIKAGQFPDLTACEKFIECVIQDEKLMIQSRTCKKIGQIQLLYNDATKNCDLPSKTICST